MLNFIKKKNYINNIILLFFVFFSEYTYSNDFFIKTHGLISDIELSLIFKTFIIMLIVVIPVFLLTIFIVFKYRESRTNEIYDPEWSHSYIIEFIIWFVPIIIVLFLSKLSWDYTHRLDPCKKIQSNNSVITIHAISLDWKWLFIYPDYNVATINEIVIPIDTPVCFHVTSYSVMNSLFIPQLGSQIYSMAGMETHLNLIAKKSGLVKGFSSNYSGKGFSDMKFKVLIVKNDKFFNNWIKNLKKSKNNLSSEKKFLKIAKSSKNFLIKHYSHVDSLLFYKIIKMFK